MHNLVFVTHNLTSYHTTNSVNLGNPAKIQHFTPLNQLTYNGWTFQGISVEPKVLFFFNLYVTDYWNFFFFSTCHSPFWNISFRISLYLFCHNHIWIHDWFMISAGYEIRGLENVPDGPFLVIYYHGALPIDMYYFTARMLLFKRRHIHTVADRFMFKIPGKSAIAMTYHA